MIRLAQSIIQKSVKYTINNNISQYSNNANITVPSLFTPLVKYNFGIMDYATKKGRDKKASDANAAQVKKEIDLLANKPNYTILDYKQRIMDQLDQIRKKGFGMAKYLNQNVEEQKLLQMQKKIFLAMFDEQLKSQQLPKGQTRVAIGLASQIPLANVVATFKKFRIQQQMHRMLRGMKERGQQLPKTMEELQYAFLRSGMQHSSEGRKEKYAKYQTRTKASMNRYIKWGQPR